MPYANMHPHTGLEDTGYNPAQSIGIPYRRTPIALKKLKLRILHNPQFTLSLENPFGQQQPDNICH